jgi:hypothetical protein
MTANMDNRSPMKTQFETPGSRRKRRFATERPNCALFGVFVPGLTEGTIQKQSLQIGGNLAACFARFPGPRPVKPAAATTTKTQRS